MMHRTPRASIATAINRRFVPLMLVSPGRAFGPRPLWRATLLRPGARPLLGIERACSLEDAQRGEVLVERLRHRRRLRAGEGGLRLLDVEVAGRARLHVHLRQLVALAREL